MQNIGFNDMIKIRRNNMRTCNCHRRGNCSDKDKRTTEYGYLREDIYPSDKSIKLADQKGYTVIFGEIRSGDEIIDEVLLTVFRAPHSYTGENSVEISCHASPYIIRKDS